MRTLHDSGGATPASRLLAETLETRLFTPTRSVHGGVLQIRPPVPERCAQSLFRREGEYWTVVYAERTIRMRDSVGVRHLAQLLWHPHREFHALDLMRAVAATGATRGGPRPGSITPASIDTRAVASYRRRIRELEEEALEAEDRHDLGHADRARTELDAILRELREGARGRRIAVDVERARTAVTKTIKAALIRIRPAHPPLAFHLEATVKRGYVCVYRPDPRSPIRWDD